MQRRHFPAGWRKWEKNRKISRAPQKQRHPYSWEMYKTHNFVSHVRSSLFHFVGYDVSMGRFLDPQSQKVWPFSSVFMQGLLGCIIAVPCETISFGRRVEWMFIDFWFSCWPIWRISPLFPGSMDNNCTNPYVFPKVSHLFSSLRPVRLWLRPVLKAISTKVGNGNWGKSQQRRGGLVYFNEKSHLEMDHLWTPILGNLHVDVESCGIATQNSNITNKNGTYDLFVERLHLRGVNNDDLQMVETQMVSVCCEPGDAPWWHPIQTMIPTNLLQHPQV